jgi:hypothetical protein
MTVETTLTKARYAGNGAATEFPVPFAYSRAADLRLVLSDAAGNETPVADNYRVDVNPSGDASVAYPVSGSPLPPGVTLTVYRDTPQTQIVDLIDGGDFDPNVLERDGFDRLEMQIQELQEESDRAIKTPIISDMTPEDYWRIITDSMRSFDEMQRLYDLLIAAGVVVTLKPNGGIAFDDQKRIYVDLKSTGGLSQDNLGRIYVDLQSGGGLTYDSLGHIYVDFSTMPTDKFEAMLKSIRVPIWLNANKTWYVDPVGGNNNNNGETPDNAFKTVTYGANYVASNFNVDKYIATLQLAAGTYSEKITLPKYSATSGNIRIVGESMDSTILAGSISGLNSAGQWPLLNLTLRSDAAAGPGTTYQSVGILVNTGCTITITNVYFDFDVAPNTAAGVTNSLPVIIAGGSLEILAGCEFNMPAIAAGRAFWQIQDGILRLRQPTVLNGVVSVATINETDGAKFVRVNTPNSPSSIITGTVTGKRYQGTQGSTFNTGGGGANYFPGTITGTANGDLYS